MDSRALAGWKGGVVMKYDYSKLIGRIIEVFGTRAAFAESMHISIHTLSFKLNNKLSWKQTEMERAAKLLDFPLSDIQAYFFSARSSK